MSEERLTSSQPSIGSCTSININVASHSFNGSLRITAVPTNNHFRSTPTRHQGECYSLLQTGSGNGFGPPRACRLSQTLPPTCSTETSVRLQVPLYHLLAYVFMPEPFPCTASRTSLSYSLSSFWRYAFARVRHGIGPGIQSKNGNMLTMLAVGVHNLASSPTACQHLGCGHRE